MKIEEATVILVLIVVVLGIIFYQVNESGILLSPGEGFSKKTCESLPGTEADSCWSGLANQVFDQKDSEKKSKEYCIKISDTQTRDECLSNIALNEYDTCLAMSSKSSELFFDCVLFVTNDVQSCESRLSAADSKYLAECIEDNAVRMTDCDKIPNTDSVKNIKEECENHFA